MKYFAYLCLLVLFTACSSGKTKQNKEQTEAPTKWSIKIRITSYNVCYTKLLRVSFCRFENQKPTPRETTRVRNMIR